MISRKKMNFSEYSTVSKRPSQKQFQNICENREDKTFFLVSKQKVLLSSFLRAKKPGSSWNNKTARFFSASCDLLDIRKAASSVLLPRYDRIIILMLKNEQSDGPNY